MCARILGLCMPLHSPAYLVPILPVCCYCRVSSITWSTACQKLWYVHPWKYILSSLNIVLKASVTISWFLYQSVCVCSLVTGVVCRPGGNALVPTSAGSLVLSTSKSCHPSKIIILSATSLHHHFKCMYSSGKLATEIRPQLGTLTFQTPSMRLYTTK